MPAWPTTQYIQDTTLSLNSWPEEPPEELMLWLAEAKRLVKPNYLFAYTILPFFITLLPAVEFSAFFVMWTFSNTSLLFCKGPEHLSKEGLQWRVFFFSLYHFNPISHTPLLSSTFRQERPLQHLHSPTMTTQTPSEESVLEKKNTSITVSAC